MRARIIFFVLLSALSTSLALAAEATSPEINDAKPIKFIPLPVYATLPNEGATYGFMPVFLDPDPKSGQIYSILAPSVTWNGVSHITSTGRYFQYPNEFEEHIFQATYATRLFREAIADWNVMPWTKGSTTRFFSFNYRADPYRRFFGIGKDTSKSDETTYTLDTIRLWTRFGYNVTNHVNINASFGFRHDKPHDTGVLGIKSTYERFPNENGLQGSNSYHAFLGVRYETRPIREYSTHGVMVEGQVGGVADSAANSDVFALMKLESKALWEETTFLYGAARAYWAYGPGKDIPFYERQSLGGSFLLRGFILDRFVDNGAWAVDLEQRITPYILHIGGSTVHIRVDPFATFGQVFHDPTQMISKVRGAYGVGLRAFAPPNVIGRIDVARNDEQETNVYVELGYPF
jgi:hypothetical protein